MPTTKAKARTKSSANAKESSVAKWGTRPRRRAPTAARASGAGRAPAARSTSALVKEVLRELERKGSAKGVAGLARFGITARGPYGVSVGDLRRIAKQLGRSHELAEALWATDRYEARMLACLVDEPERVTPAQMDHWCRDFDNWGITDTACFCLFDRVPHAWKKIVPWGRLQAEHSRRAAFALLASLALHDKRANDTGFRDGLRLVEAAATDERNFVKKGVLWALRAIGLRNAALHTAALATARRLAASTDRTSRWIGASALRELGSPAAQRRLARAAKNAR